jgi:N-acetylglucosaminyldiphosphoundecaprenol N-acetyl-beta-D-mannosaminyltransferase
LPYIRQSGKNPREFQTVYQKGPNCIESIHTPVNPQKSFGVLKESTELERICILGIPISEVTCKSEVMSIEALLEDSNSHYIIYANVHVLVTAQKDEFLRLALQGADMVSPDGMPIIWASRLLGKSGMEKCSGPDIMELLLAKGVKRGYRHYFYGSTSDTLERLRRKLESGFPGIQIAGMMSPPFRKLTQEEDQAIVDELNRLNPDFIWVGLGAPKQEIWMNEHRNRLKHGVMLGVGAAFNFLAGNMKRAPRWMQSAGMEWLFRLSKEPKRLWRRYLYTNSVFFLYMVRLFFARIFFLLTGR